MQQKSIGKQIWRIAGPLVIQYVISVFVGISAGVYFLSRHFSELIAVAKNSSTEQVAKISTEMSAKMLEEAMKYTTEITMITAILTIPVMLFLFYRDKKKSTAPDIGVAEKAQLWKYAGIVALGIASCIALNNLVALSNITFLSDQYEEVSTGFYSAGFIVQILGLGIIAPVSEELLFRGILYKRLKEHVTAKMAMFHSALLFALYHGNLVQAVYGFVLGLLFAYLYEQYGSLKAPILAHVVINLTSIILTKIGGFDWIFMTPLKMGIVTVACAAVAASVFVMVQKIGKNSVEIENQTVE